MVDPVTSTDSYLDGVCGRLEVNPAAADDIREELGSHLEELAQAYAAEGNDPREAAALAIAHFGDAGKLHDCLDRVHQGDAWWLLRLKGLGLGMLLGALLGAAIPVGGHLEVFARLLPLSDALGTPQGLILLNAILAGGLIGLLAAGGRGLLVGWSAGSLLWLGEYVVYWITGVASGAADPAANMLNSVLLAPLLGGTFGAAVGASSSVILSATSRIRPQIQ
jgi:hypothetical protein